MEEWNEFGELKENIGPVPANNAAPAGGQIGVNIAPPLSVNPTATQGTAKVSQPPVSKAPVSKAPPPLLDDSKMRPIALPGAAEIAARNKKPTSSSNLEAINAETMTSSPEDKKSSIEEASKANLNAPAAATNIDHLSAPASRLHSGTATPAQTEEPSGEAPKAAEKHRGSDVVEAPSEEIKKIESETSLKEEEVEDPDESAATKGVEGLKVADETAKPQEESAKEAEDATKTVED